MGRHQSIELSKSYHIRAIHTLESEVDEHGVPLIHGHDCSVIVTVRGDVDSENGMLMSRDVLDQEVQKCIVQKYDKKNLNLILKVPSGENLAIQFLKDLKSSKIGDFVISVRIIETRKNQFICKVIA